MDKQSILSHRYENGLVLVAEPMRWLESAAFTFLVPAGCAYEPRQRLGLGGFTCEMTMRGAGDRDSRRFIESLDNLGVERGESVSDAHISYSGATLAESLRDVLTIYADVLRRPRLPAEQFEAARQVMLQELQAVEDDPHHKVMLELRRRHFLDPWGRPNHGQRDALEATTRDDVQQYFASLYRPNGTVLGVAGCLEWEPLKDLVGQLFADWRTVPTPALPSGASEPKCEHLPYESQQTQIGIAYPSVPYRHADYFRAWGAVGALSGGMSSRFFTEVREKRGLCYSVYASYQTLRDLGCVACYAGSSAQRAQETLDVMLAELARLAAGIEEQELERLKARIKSALIMQQESSSARSSAIARDWYHLERVRTLDEVSALVDGLSREAINAYLADNPPRDFTIVTLGPRPLEVHARVS